ncbi:MAG TPA: CAP domain-containing protein [Planctomycetota bacterium]|nr:CAP domain-containing protein [Planctomycetota bacterium]
MRCGLCVLALLTALPGEDKPLRVQMVAQDAPGHWQAQLLGDLDRPVGDKIEFGGQTLPARVNDRGALELDVKNDGKPRTISGKREIVTVPLKGSGEKPRSFNARLEFRKNDEGKWVYRNLTQLHVVIGTEQFVIVDANGNGSYNDVGVDGVAWEGRSWLFPLPAESERWCSATMEFTGLQFGSLGEAPTIKGRPIATTVASALPILKGVNEERAQIGLTPRPEDEKLSADLQKHCKYMAMNNTLTHAETRGKPGYSEEGNQAGLRSILGQGSPPDLIAENMVGTYFHRQDVIRPGTQAFGVGVEGAFTGIDGRSSLAKVPEHCWPVLCPVPGQSGVGTTYGKEAPDATPGDSSAGYPITVYFGTSNLKLKEHRLTALAPGAMQMPAGMKLPPGTPVECYAFDPGQGASADMTRYQACVCLIPKDPLKVNVDYEVSMTVDVAGKPWSKTWRFSTSVAKSSKDRIPGR